MTSSTGDDGDVTLEEQQLRLGDYMAKLRRNSYHYCLHDPTTATTTTATQKTKLESFAPHTSTLLIKEALVKYDSA